jgi:hypothetical protein
MKGNFTNRGEMKESFMRADQNVISPAHVLDGLAKNTTP